MTDTHDTYQSAFSWRYGSRAMRQIWSETNRRVMMRKVWLALASAQHKAGLVSAAQLADLQEHVDDVDIGRAFVIEKEIHHDVMAEIRTFAEQCPKGGGIIHWGATSADITDNADVLRKREAARLLVD
jgi:adenylosuccinate lyase